MVTLVDVSLIQAPVLAIATWLCGGIFNTMDPYLHQTVVANSIHLSKPKLIMTSAPFLSKVKDYCAKNNVEVWMNDQPGGFVHIVSSSDLSPVLVLTNLQSTDTKVQVFVVLGLLFSSVGGLVVAAILKKLDNVVKEYSSATANMFTAVISAVLFPDKFQITVFILLAMGLLFTGIYLYEKKSFNCSASEENNINCDKKEQSNILSANLGSGNK